DRDEGAGYRSAGPLPERGRTEARYRTLPGGPLGQREAGYGLGDVQEVGEAQQGGKYRDGSGTACRLCAGKRVSQDELRCPDLRRNATEEGGERGAGSDQLAAAVRGGTEGKAKDDRARPAGARKLRPATGWRRQARGSVQSDHTDADLRSGQRSRPF